MLNPTIRAQEEPSDLSIRLLALSLSSDCENRGVSPRNYAHRARVIRQQTELLIAAIDQERPRRTLLTMSWTMKGHASGQIDDRASGQGSAHCAHLPSVGSGTRKSTLMQNLRLLITSAFEALLGESFPRRVTAVNRKTRWLGYSGRSFETREEALRN